MALNITKGKWEEVGAFVRCGVVDICSTCNVNNLPLEEAEANAQHIVDMHNRFPAFEAIHEALIIIVDDWLKGKSVCQESINAARQALKLARGE